MRKLMAVALAATLSTTMLAACGGEEPVAEASAYTASQYGAAIRDIARPEPDKERDEGRKPGELLAFAQIDRGDVVGDYMMGGGYITRLLAIAVGIDGKVYAFQPDEFIAFRAEYGTEQDAAVEPYTNDQGENTYVIPLRGPVATPEFPEPLDTIITVMNLHDLYLPGMGENAPETAAASLFAALKPGGSLIVVDHHAAEGAGAEAATSLHRMDAALALDLLTGAGFVLEEESDLYSRPEDPRDANVFDPAIQGMTDQFAWRLRKPEA